MANKTLWRVLTTLARAGLMIEIFLAVFTMGSMYGELQENQSVYDFFTKEYRYTFDRINPDFSPIEAQVDYYNTIVHYVWYALGFVVLYFVFDYFYDKENHFITTIKKKFAGFKFDDEV